MLEKQKEWYLGLDIGSNSIGFSATDAEYTILTKSGNLQCGSRLFEGARDASERRGFRSSRRRLERRKVRINLLQELFNKKIAEKDQAFFVRLNESRLHLEDKRIKVKYPLFNDKEFTDREYYAKFPTIYHLRKHLIENDETDIRLIYLACHHLIKYRGHFLSPDFNPKRSNEGYKKIIEEINTLLSDGEDIKTFDTTNIASISDIIKNKSKSAKEQSVAIQELINPHKNDRLEYVFNAIEGNKIVLSKIWDDEDLKKFEKEMKDDLKDFKFSSLSEKYEACYAIVEKELNDDQLGLLVLLKSFHDALQCDRVLFGYESVAQAMAARYDEHKTDLKILKDFIKKNLSKDEYNKMFRLNNHYKDKGSDHGSYCNYVGSNITHRQKSISHSSMCVKKGEEPVTASYEHFLKYTENLLEKANEEATKTKEYGVLMGKIENKTLCKIHNTQDNSYIPYQLNEFELRTILDKQANHFPFLKEKDQYGSIADKIISLLTFRIPYYVGPLSEKDDKFAWIKKKEGFANQKVLPWNFDEIVDKSASGEAFITRMTAKCTYLKAEDVIPKQSLLYQKYMVLNDLNNLKINGNRISQELKMFLFNGICQKEISLSKAKIKENLIEHGKIKKEDTIGKEDENDKLFNSSLSSLIKFKKELGDNVDKDMCEDIIKLHTVFGDEKSLVKEKIKTKYSCKLNENQIEKLSKLSFSGWARFSTKFLSGITATDESTGETGLTIIKILEETTLNLIEILNSDNYTLKFVDTIEKENAREGDIQNVSYDLIEDLYCSPLVKRSIWQAILISKELTKINGQPPKKVFIEVTRGENKKKKGKMTSSRRKQIEELFKKAIGNGLDIQKLKDEFDKKKDEREFRSDKLYFYFAQLGKCMYSGNVINLENLNNDNLYDIDHIYPQSKIKDDSLTNRVLVCRGHNAEKSNMYPIAKDTREKMKSFWDMLKGKNFISAEKYNRLICSQPLSNDILAGFINRQLVSTNQAVKETANVLKRLFNNDTKIVYSKASHVSDFRNTYDLIKCREVNNLHHAHDAYLNIVVGNVWDSVYGQYWKENFTFNENNALDKLFIRDIQGVWNPAYIQKIKDYLFDNKKYLGKFPVVKQPYEKKGAFYDQTIHPKGKGQYELSKGLDPMKYGGYKAGNTAYNCLIEYDDKKGKRIPDFFPVPVRYVGRFSGHDLIKQIALDKKVTNPALIKDKIWMFSVLEIDGVRYHMRSGDLQCSVTIEWYPDKDIIQIVRDIVKYLKLTDKKEITKDVDTKNDIVFATREKNKNNKESKSISPLKNLKLFDAIIEQIKKPFYVRYPFSKKVKDGKISRDKFKELSTYQQAIQLMQLLNFITMNSVSCNAKEIGGRKNEVCKYEVEAKRHEKCIYLITQSVTGLFEKRIPLITLQK